jgi:hypothetical protein
MKRPTRVAAIAVALTTLAIGAGMSRANSAEPQEYSTSGSTVSPSMVVGSSRTTLGNSPLAKTPAGKAAMTKAAVSAGAAVDPSGEYTTASALVQYEKPDGTVIGSKRYGAATQGQRLPAFQKTATALSAHAEGTSSSAGCVKVTVGQTRHGPTGDTLWKFSIWTDWCWTRSNQVVSVNGHNWYIGSVDGNFQWKGLVNTQAYYYDFSTDDGHPKSAYYHYRMGQFDNCVLKYGCVGTEYPMNYLRSYYNGTWVWDTDV